VTFVPDRAMLKEGIRFTVSVLFTKPAGKARAVTSAISRGTGWSVEVTRLESPIN